VPKILYGSRRLGTRRRKLERVHLRFRPLPPSRQFFYAEFSVAEGMSRRFRFDSFAEEFASCGDKKSTHASEDADSGVGELEAYT